MIAKKRIHHIVSSLNQRQKQQSSDLLADVCKSLKALSEKIGCLVQQKQKRQNFDRIQQRFQKVFITIPTLPSLELQNLKHRKLAIEKWLCKLCQEVFSVAFSAFEYQKLNDRNTKAFCCQNMILNIIKMVKHNNLTVQQISHIDKCLRQQLIPYFMIKYPMSEQAEVNLEFANKVVEVEGNGTNQIDLVFRSKIQFEYKQSGNYNQQIMKLLNYIIERPNKKFQSSDLTLYKLFYQDMESFFKNVQEQDFTVYMNNYDPRSEQKKQFKQLTNLSIQQQKQKQKYRQSVRSYTKKLIGRKISQNIKPYTEIQVKQGDLIFKSPAIMRIVTKWCVELMSNFDTIPNILNKEDQFRMKDGGQKILKRKHLLILSQLLIREKKKVDEYLKKVNKNNSQCQFDFIFQKLPSELQKFSQDECQVGFFSCSLIRNYQTYLVGYINTIIHALMSATKDYEEMVKAYEYQQQQYGKQIENWRRNLITFQDLVNKAYSYRLASVPITYISLIPQLVSFTVGDLMRCRCTSKQKQIIALYTQLERKSRNKNSDIKIVKIKNRLQKGTKDILINILYKNAMVVQMQLAVTTVRSKFIDFSNKFNHVLYQLKRAQFGPVSEMCNIWINNDIKSEFYTQKVKQYNIRKFSLSKGQNHKCAGIKIQFPFRCSQCEYFYTDCGYILKHIQCTHCNKFICSLCQAQKFTYRQISQKFIDIPKIQVLGMLPNQKYWKYRQQISLKQKSNNIFRNKQNAGLVIDLKGDDKKYKLCKTSSAGKKIIIFILENDGIKVYKQILNEYELLKFKNQYLIFQSPQLTAKIKDILSAENQQRSLTQFAFPKLIKKWYQKQKTTLTFMHGQLTDQDIKKIKYKFPFVFKVCFYNNHLQNFQQMVQKFCECQIFDLGQNSIQDLTFKGKLPSSLQHIKVLYLNYNKISNVSENFIQRFQKLQQLQLANNNLHNLPSNFGSLKCLKILNISRNRFQLMPEEITNLNQLQVLNFYSSKTIGHKIKELPQSIGNLKKLRKLNLNLNSIKSFPNSIGELSNLQILYAMNNNIQELPESFNKLNKLKILNLAQNCFINIPPQIGNLTQLQVLNFQNSTKDNGQKHKLPDSFCNLVNIKMMDISKNYINHLPGNIGNLQKLQTLFIYENQIKQIPQSIGNLKHLRLLYASNNLLSTLPDSICNLQNLQKITLKQNIELKNIPSNIGNLKKLKYMFCNGSGLTQIPSSIGELTDLSQLLLKKTNIRHLPQEIKKIKNLTRFQIDIEKLDPQSKEIFKSVVQIQHIN